MWNWAFFSLLGEVGDVGHVQLKLAKAVIYETTLTSIWELLPLFQFSMFINLIIVLIMRKTFVHNICILNFFSGSPCVQNIFLMHLWKLYLFIFRPSAASVFRVNILSDSTKRTISVYFRSLYCKSSAQPCLSCYVSCTLFLTFFLSCCWCHSTWDKGKR